MDSYTNLYGEIDMNDDNSLPLYPSTNEVTYASYTPPLKEESNSPPFNFASNLNYSQVQRTFTPPPTPLLNFKTTTQRITELGVQVSVMEHDEEEAHFSLDQKICEEISDRELGVATVKEEIEEQGVVVRKLGKRSDSHDRSILNLRQGNAELMRLIVKLEGRMENLEERLEKKEEQLDHLMEILMEEEKVKQKRRMFLSQMEN